MIMTVHVFNVGTKIHKFVIKIKVQKILYDTKE